MAGSVVCVTIVPDHDSRSPLQRPERNCPGRAIRIYCRREGWPSGFPTGPSGMAVVLNNTQYYVYVLRSLRDGKLYTGVTSDLDRRVREHNSGKTKSLRGRRPLALAYWEQHPTKVQALARERYFKTPEGGLVKQTLVAQTEGWPSGFPTGPVRDGGGLEQHPVLCVRPAKPAGRQAVHGRHVGS